MGEWERLLSKQLGPDYKRVAGESLWAIHLLVFAHKGIAHHVRHVRTCSVATGIGNLLGNKGAAAVSLQLGALRLLFVGAHFAAHDAQVERRNADFHRIRAGLFTASPASASPHGASSVGGAVGSELGRKSWGLGSPRWTGGQLGGPRMAPRFSDGCISGCCVHGQEAIAGLMLTCMGASSSVDGRQCHQCQGAHGEDRS